MMHAYIAGPLYNEGERWFNELLDQCARDMGFSTYLPHRDLGVLARVEDGPRLFQGDLKELDCADVVIANLNGMTTDAGTSWELGYAYAQGKYLVGVHTDERIHVRFAEINLMIQNSLNIRIQTLDELRECLYEYVASHSGGI